MSVISPAALAPTDTVKKVSKDDTRAELLRRFIEAYWLRPENALWMTLRSLTLAGVAFRRPSIDVSCGDGLFSFLHMGGVFDPSFDVFCSVAALDRAGDRPVDMFDHLEPGYAPLVLTTPTDRIDVGTDFKASMLAKAERLSLYERLIEHDNEKRMPLPDAAFQTVYCNAAYWVTRIDEFLAELRRITRPCGRIVLQVKLDSMKRYTLGAHADALGRRFLEIMGSRFDCWPTLADRRTWESRFARAGLTVEAALPFITRTHAHLWDVGLRPLAPLLIRMANALNPATRASIKRDWVDLVQEILLPLCNPTLDLFDGRDEPAEIQYTLSAAK